MFTKLIWHLNSDAPLHDFTRFTSQSFFGDYLEKRDPYRLERTPYYYQDGKKSLLKMVNKSVELFPEARHFVLAYNWGPNIMSKNGEKLYQQYIADLSKGINGYSNATFCNMTNIVEYPKGYIEGDVHWNQLGTQQITESFLEDCFTK